MLGLNLSLPAAVGAAWFKAQPKATNGPKVAAYLVMSRRLQRKLKEIIPYYYFADLENFANSQLACKTLLVYAAIPPRNSMSDQVVCSRLLTKTTWEFGDQTLRRRMVRWDQTTANLKLILERVHNVLLGAGMTGTADSFAPNQAEAIQEGSNYGRQADIRKPLVAFTDRKSDHQRCSGNRLCNGGVHQA